MTIQSNRDIVTEILDRIDAPVLLKELTERLSEEQAKRQDFYENISEQAKSEFINGEVVMHSPVKLEHNETNLNLCKIIDDHVIEKNLGFVGIEKILIKLTRNDYEPDICFFKNNLSKVFVKGQMFFPAPSIVVEILSQSTEKRDRGVKFKDYEKHGVEEYWLVHPQNKTIEQYLLKNGKFELEKKTDSGIIKCIAIKGLTVPVEVIFDKKKTHDFIKNKGVKK